MEWLHLGRTDDETTQVATARPAGWQKRVAAIPLGRWSRMIREYQAVIAKG